MIGSNISHFKIVDKLGQGGMEIALGNREEARKILGKQNSGNHSFSVALIYAALGDPGTANNIISSIEEWDYWSTLAFRYFFPDVLKSLHTSPQHEQILNRINRSWGY